MDSAAVLAAVTALGAGAFVAFVNALFARRKTSAEADMTVGEAWGRFVSVQEKQLADKTKEIADLRRDNAELRGELRAARESISQLERRERESMVWQVEVTHREEAVRSSLAEQGIDLPPVPAPPVIRQPNTRASDLGGPQR